MFYNIQNFMRIDRLYDILLTLHAIAPHKLGSGLAFPMLRVTLELTYQCNLECIFCFQKNQKTRKELSENDFIRLISYIPRLTLITFTGGAPLLKKNALEIIKYALRKHRCNVITNGVLLSEKYVRTFVDKRLLLLGISIDGIDECHDKHRGKKGTFIKVKDNLQELQKYKNSKNAKYPLIDIKTVVTQENLDMLDEIYQFAIDLDADFLTLSFLKISDIQFHANFVERLDDCKLYKFLPVELYLDKAKLISLIACLMKRSEREKTKIRFYPKMTSVKGVEDYFNNSKQLIERFKPCLVPWSCMQISPDGEAYPCLAYKVGNVKQLSLMSIWNSNEFQRFRKRLKGTGLYPACEGCCYLKKKL